MKLLVLGGTGLVGRNLIENAVDRGHEPTIHHRGKTAPDVFPELEHLVGERNGELAELRGSRWNAVIDLSGRAPLAVRASTALLADAAEHYTFVSSISAYASFPVGVNEDAPLASLADDKLEDTANETYGGRKVVCEQAARSAFGDRALIARPGLIVGPHDNTERFAYWVRRIAAGGQLLAPGRADRPVQWIDARDLGAWILDMVENRATGTFNAIGPETPVSFGNMLQSMIDVVGSDAELVWCADELLEGDDDVHLPYWIPQRHTEYAGFFSADNRRALASGLRLRPLSDTIRDTWIWCRNHAPAPDAAGKNLTPEHEAELVREALTHRVPDVPRRGK